MSLFQRRSNRRRFLQFSALGLAAGAAGLRNTSQSAAWAEEEKVVNILAFSGYEEPGMLAPFEEEIGIKVNLKIHDGSDDEMISLIQTSPPGTWDIMTPTSAYVPNLAKQDYLLALNEADYPLGDYLKPLDTWPPCFVDGEMYGLLNRFGYYGITYNSEQLSLADVDSFNVLMDPKLKGKVALFDWFLPNMGVVSKWLGFDPPYQLSASQLAQVKDRLMELRPQVGLIGSTAQTTQALA
ncbi:MAG: extracellular solute-binding protein, partial [Cyanobacteria bacterium P01_F01_bin.86]